jgi:hypothetical protein
LLVALYGLAEHAVSRRRKKNRRAIGDKLIKIHVFRAEKALI